MPAQEQAHRPLTVSEAANLVKKDLESIRLTIEGEVSQVTDRESYAAVYFTLKDEHAILDCQMWRKDRFRKTGGYDKSGVKLKVGMLVRVTGRFSYYGPSGSFRFDVFSLQLAGEGMLRMQVAQLAEKLRLEGLMDAAGKRPLPAYPQRIGLVTSPSGAAVRDVLRTLRRRYPLAEVLFCGVQVEGKGAAGNIARGVLDAAQGGAEVVLLVRGGGSFESLMPFNDEKLARTVAACPVPVVTGIGHEPDNCICDMVADVRASTPTAAAEAVAPDACAIRSDLDQYANRMNGFFAHKLDVTRVYLERIANRPVFEDPSELFASRELSLDLLQGRMTRAASGALDRASTRLDVLEPRLHAAIPGNLERDGARIETLGARMSSAVSARVQRGETRIEALEGRMAAAVPARIQRDGARVDALGKRLAVSGANMLAPFDHGTRLAAARLHDLSPLSVIGRGYSIARDGQGAIVRSVDQVKQGSKLEVSVSDGVLDCTVDGVSEKGASPGNDV